MAKPYKAEVYRDAAGGWRFRVLARNGKEIAGSGEGFKRKGNALRRVRDLGVPDDKVVVQE